MKILMSAYACETNQGSEPGIGWNWVTQMARQGHEVIALIYPIDRENIELAMEKDPIPTLKFEYLDTPAWLSWWYSRIGRKIYVHYLGWQILAYFRARKIIKQDSIDVIQHVTMGSFRVPSFLSLLGKPFVFGPIGGGESAPRSLIEKLPFKYKIKEIVRSLANKLHKWDPFLRMTLSRSNLVLCKTSETLKLLPTDLKGKAKILRDVGIDTPSTLFMKDMGNDTDDQEIKLLFVGRLLYWKGIHLAIRAIAKIRETNKNVKLTIIGRGPDKEWLQQVERSNSLEANVEWKEWMDQKKLFELYHEYDVFLFPSLHDSGGSVVLEAIARGLPVVCLNLGGPKELINNKSGRVVSIEDLSEEEIIDSLACHVLEVTHTSRREHYRKGAWQESKEMSWENLVKESLNLMKMIPELEGKLHVKKPPIKVLDGVSAEKV